jgi:hypothetical protein
MPVTLATQEAEVRRVEVQSQPGQIVHKTLSREKTQHKNRAGGVAQGEGPKFKPQYCKKKKKNQDVGYSPCCVTSSCPPSLDFLCLVGP